MMPVRLYVEPHSAVRAHVVLRRGLRTLAVLGTWTPLHGWDLTDSHGGDPDEWPADLRVQQFPATA